MWLLRKKQYKGRDLLNCLLISIKLMSTWQINLMEEQMNSQQDVRPEYRQTSANRNKKQVSKGLNNITKSNHASKGVLSDNIRRQQQAIPPANFQHFAYLRLGMNEPLTTDDDQQRLQWKQTLLKKLQQYQLDVFAMHVVVQDEGNLMSCLVQNLAAAADG